MKLNLIKGSKLSFGDMIQPKPDDRKDDNIRFYTQQDMDLWEKRYDEAMLLMSSEEKQQEGIALIFALAEEGYPEARRTVSDFYIQGIGVPEDFGKAIEWERRAVNAEYHLKTDILQDSFNLPQQNT